jgi:glycosyltransferase involved in cell wall biosynthesis
MNRLAIVTTHPIQYYAPWFRFLATRPNLDVRVFYLWDFGVTTQTDRGFGQAIQWDVPLLDGYPLEFVPNRSQQPGTHYFWGIDNPELPGRLDKFNPDAVLLMGYNYASFLRQLLASNRWWGRREVPLLLRGDSHRLVPRKGPKEWLRRFLIAALFRRFRAFLVVGSANRAYYRHHGVPEKKLFFSPHAIDNDRFCAARPQAIVDARAWKWELGIADNDRVVLFAGKFENKKRPQDLVDAFQRAAVPGTSLLLVGSGDLEPALRQQAGSSRNIYFAPFQNQSLMPRTYAAADVVVLPSQGSGETWGLCINEAMCLAKPVIVSSHVGCARDLVVPGRNGLVFEAGDVDGLAACLRQSLAYPDQLERWGQASQELVQSYSYLRATEGLEAALSWIERRN